MKTATLPSLRVDPRLRRDAEAVLQEGETLSSFVEHAVRVQVGLRREEEVFIARGLLARERARRTGVYVSSEEVLKGLGAGLSRAKAGKRSG